MLYYGMIQKVIPPNDPVNYNKYQYEYLVLVTMANSAQVPLNHVIVDDEFGSSDNFNDRTFKVGERVLVQCPLDNLTAPVIVGALRNSRIKTNHLFGHHTRRRFNQIEEIIDQNNGWAIYVKPDGSTEDTHEDIGSVGVGSEDGPERNLNIGPSMQLNPKFIIFDDSNGQVITFDIENKTLKIDCNELAITVTGNAQISVKKDATVTVEGNLTANVTGNASVTAKNLVAEAKEKATIKSPKIAIGDGGVELLKTVQDLVDGIGKLQALSPLGPCAPLTAAPQWSQVLSLNKKLAGITGKF